MPVDTINQEDVLSRPDADLGGPRRRPRAGFASVSVPSSSGPRLTASSSTTRQARSSTARCRVMPKVKNHLRALPYQEVGGLVEAVRQSQASLAAKWCLEFLILTAVRSGEARGAAWSEIDMDAAIWTVPAARMKANAEHRVPLCGRVLEILGEVRAIDDGSDLVFPSPSLPGRPLRDMALIAVLRRVGVADRATVHGFRSSFRDFAAECTNAKHAVMGVEPCPLRRQRR